MMFTFSFNMCVCVHTLRVHVHVCACIHMCIWRPEVDIWLLLQLLTILYIEVDFSQNPELTISASMANQFVLVISCFYQVDRLTGGVSCQHGFFIGSGDLNSGPHVCMLRTLPTEPLPPS